MKRKWSIAGIVAIALFVLVEVALHVVHVRMLEADEWHKVQPALEAAEEYELLSLHPRLSDGEFHFHQVLGRVKIVDPSIRGQLNDALKRSAQESKGRTKPSDKPRHGIRVRCKGELVDLRIDFEGHEVRVYRNNEPEGTFAITDKAQPLFNRMLREAGIAVIGKFDSEDDNYQRFGRSVGSAGN